jgi:predicted metal-dependent peptidase
MSNIKLTPREKISKAKITLLNNNPFFGNLTIHLNPIEVDFVPTVGVDIYGNLYYNPEYFEKLDSSLVEGVLIHEVLHCVFKDLERKGNRIEIIWNMASDYANNLLVLENGYKLPEGALIDKQFKDKIKEEIYDIILKNFKQYNIPSICNGDCNKCKISKKIKKKGQGICRKGLWDYHITKSDTKKLSKEVRRKISKSDKDWRAILKNAYKHAKNQGMLPAGFNRIFKQLFPPKIDWKTVLLRFIESQIPYDFTWRRPSKRSSSLGVYLPQTLKEYVEVVCGIDLSGSISDKEYAEFISECVGIVKAFPRVKMTLISHDVDVQSIVEVDNAFQLYNIKLKGGGGTSHIPLFKYINKYKPDTKVLICFTDGYTSYPDNPDLYRNLKVLWIFTKESSEEKPPFGYLVRMYPKREEYE